MRINKIPFKNKVLSDYNVIIDVRTPLEYNSGHIKDAKNIDLYSDDFNTEFDKLDKSKPVYVYCRSGGPSPAMLFRRTRFPPPSTPDASTRGPRPLAL